MATTGKGGKFPTWGQSGGVTGTATQICIRQRSIKSQGNLRNELRLEEERRGQSKKKRKRPVVSKEAKSAEPDTEANWSVHPCPPVEETLTELIDLFRFEVNVSSTSQKSQR